MACDRSEPCKFPSLDSCQKRFLWTHKEVDLVPHVVGLVFKARGDAEKFSKALGFNSLDVLYKFVNTVFHIKAAWSTAPMPLRKILEPEAWTRTLQQKTYSFMVATVILAY